MRCLSCVGKAMRRPVTPGWAGTDTYAFFISWGDELKLHSLFRLFVVSMGVGCSPMRSMDVSCCFSFRRSRSACGLGLGSRPARLAAPCGGQSGSYREPTAVRVCRKVLSGQQDPLPDPLPRGEGVVCPLGELKNELS